MKKYTKPTVQVVNLRSSNDIAASFSDVRNQFVRGYLKENASENYAVSVYSNTVSNSSGVEVLPTVEG